MGELIIRTLRKLRSDGLRSVADEGANVLAESEPSQYAVRRLLLDDVRSISRRDLLATSETSVRNWQVFPDAEWSESVPMPGKIWIEATRDFEELPVESPQEPYVFELEDATLVHPFGIALWRGSVIEETLGHESRIAKALARSVKRHGYREVERLVRSDEALPEARLESAVSLIPLWNNYYHWTVECATRIPAIERYRKVTGKDPTLLVPENPPTWLRESLSLLGISERTYRPLTEHVRVSNLVVPTYPRRPGISCRWVRDTMLDAVDSTDGTGNRIYISRRNATRRRVRNEDDVVETLREYGFESYALEERSVAKQVELFANAELVVAPHGAGLANVLYSDDVTIIELFGESKKTTFYRLAKLLDHDYRFLLNEERATDLVVNVPELKRRLDAILSEKEG